MMNHQFELYSVVVAVNVVVASAVLFALAPLDATLWVWPVFLIFSTAMVLYWS